MSLTRLSENYKENRSQCHGQLAMQMSVLVDEERVMITITVMIKSACCILSVCVYVCMWFCA